MDTSKLSSGATAQKSSANKSHQPQKKQIKKPGVTINTGNNVLIGSAFQATNGIQTAQAAQSQSHSFVQIMQKKTPTNKASSHLHNVVIQHQNQVRGASNSNIRAQNHQRQQVPLRVMSIGEANRGPSDVAQQQKKSAARSVSSKNNTGMAQPPSNQQAHPQLKQNHTKGVSHLANPPASTKASKHPETGLSRDKILLAHNKVSHKAPFQISDVESKQSKAHSFQVAKSQGRGATQQKPTVGNKDQFGQKIKHGNPEINPDKYQQLQTKLLSQSQPKSSNISQIQTSNQQAYGIQVMLKEQQHGRADRNETIGQMNSSGHSEQQEIMANSQERLAIRIIKPGSNAEKVMKNSGNETTTSACNKSFQFGYSQQLGQALVSVSSKGRGGSSGSNTRTKTRHRSGSNKNITQTSQNKKKKEMNNPNITIVTNKDQIIQGIGKGIGVSTVKTAHGSREPPYIPSKVSSTKHQKYMGTDIRSGIGTLNLASGQFSKDQVIKNQTAAKSTLASAKQQSSKIKGAQPAKPNMQLMSREKIEVLKAFNSSNIPQIFPRECVTTKSQVNDGQHWNKLAGDHFRNLKNLHMGIPAQPDLNQAPSTKHSDMIFGSQFLPTGKATQDQFEYFTGSSAIQGSKSAVNQKQKEEQMQNFTAQQYGHSTILNKFGQENLIKQSQKTKGQGTIPQIPDSKVDAAKKQKLQPNSKPYQSHTVSGSSKQANYNHAGQEDTFIEEDQRNIEGYNSFLEQETVAYRQSQYSSGNDPNDTSDFNSAIPEQSLGYHNLKLEQSKIDKCTNQHQPQFSQQISKLQSKPLGENIKSKVGLKTHQISENDKNFEGKIYQTLNSEQATQEDRIHPNPEVGKKGQFLNKTEDKHAKKLKADSKLNSKPAPAKSKQVVAKSSYAQKQLSANRHRFSSKSGQRKSSERQIQSKQNPDHCNQSFNHQAPWRSNENQNISAPYQQYNNLSNEDSQFILQKSVEEEKRAISQDEIDMSQGELKSQTSQRSRQSKQSRQSRQSKQAQYQQQIRQTYNSHLGEPPAFQPHSHFQQQQIIFASQNKSKKPKNAAFKRAENDPNSEKKKQSMQFAEEHGNESQQMKVKMEKKHPIKTMSKNSSQSHQQSKQRLQGMQMHQQSQPNLPSSGAHQNLQGSNYKLEQKNSLSEIQKQSVIQPIANKSLSQQTDPNQTGQSDIAQKQYFFQQEIKKRDNIVLFLCQKVQNMESQLELLRNQQNKSSNPNLTEGGEMRMSLAGPLTIGTQSHSAFPKADLANKNEDFFKEFKEKLKDLDNFKILEEFGAKDDENEKQVYWSNDQSTQQVEKLDETAESPVQVNNQRDDQYENTAGFIQTDKEMGESKVHDSEIQEYDLQNLQYQFLNSNLSQFTSAGIQSQDRIRQAFMEMQDKLEKFRQFNNPQRIADLRKMCATSITQNSLANTGRISSRLQESCGGTGRAPQGNKISKINTQKTRSIGHQINRPGTRHFQTTSDVEVNSLITVGEDFSKFTRQSNKISDQNTGNCREGSSPFLQSEQAKQISEGDGNRQVATHQNSNLPDFFLPLSQEDGLDTGRSKEAIAGNEETAEDDTLIPNQADVQDIIAQGGVMLSNDGIDRDPMLMSADEEDEQEEDKEEVGEQELIGNLVGDSSIIIYDQLDTYNKDKLNFAMGIGEGRGIQMEGDRMDLDEETNAQQHFSDQQQRFGDSEQQYTDDEFNQQAFRDYNQAEFSQKNHQKDDIKELENMMNLQSDEETGNNSTLSAIEKLWRKQQEEKENDSAHILSDFQMNKNQNFIQTQKVQIPTKIEVPVVEQHIQVSKLHKSFETGVEEEKAPRQGQSASRKLQMEGLSKTLSKETLLQKLKRANIKNLGNQQKPPHQKAEERKQRSKLFLQLQSKQVSFKEEQVKRIKLVNRDQPHQPPHAQKINRESAQFQKRTNQQAAGDSMEMKLQILDEMDNNEGMIQTNSRQIPPKQFHTSKNKGQEYQNYYTCATQKCYHPSQPSPQVLFQNYLNEGQSQNDQLFDTTFQPINISQSSLHRQKEDQDQGFFVLENQQNQSNVESQPQCNFAATVVKQQQISQTPNKRPLKKKQGIHKGEPVPYQSLIQIQNKAQKLFNPSKGQALAHHLEKKQEK